MRPTLSLIRREFSAFFFSPIAYVVLFVFLAVMGYLFYLTLDQLTETGPRGVAYSMELMVGNNAFWLVYLFIPPLLTMRLFAEERSSGTLEMLMTAPIRDWQVVLAKYIACYGVYVVMWLPTLGYLPILADWHISYSTIDFDNLPAVTAYFGVAVFLGLTALVFALMCVTQLFRGRFMACLGSLLTFAVFAGLGTMVFGSIFYWGQWMTIECGIDPWPIATTYLGLALAGAMFLAIGLFVSSLVTSQMIAALVSLFIGVIFIAGRFFPEMDSFLYELMFYVTVPLHFERHFSRGLIDTRQLVLYGSVTLFCLFLTVRSLESRRWR